MFRVFDSHLLASPTFGIEALRIVRFLGDGKNTDLCRNKNRIYPPKRNTCTLSRFWVTKRHLQQGYYGPDLLAPNWNSPT